MIAGINSNFTAAYIAVSNFIIQLVLDKSSFYKGAFILQ